MPVPSLCGRKQFCPLVSFLMCCNRANAAPAHSRLPMQNGICNDQKELKPEAGLEPTAFGDLLKHLDASENQCAVGLLVLESEDRAENGVSLPTIAPSRHKIPGRIDGNIYSFDQQLAPSIDR